MSSTLWMSRPLSFPNKSPKSSATHIVYLAKRPNSLTCFELASIEIRSRRCYGKCMSRLLLFVADFSPGTWNYATFARNCVKVYELPQHRRQTPKRHQFSCFRLISCIRTSGWFRAKHSHCGSWAELNWYTNLRRWVFAWFGVLSNELTDKIRGRDLCSAIEQW